MTEENTSRAWNSQTVVQFSFNRRRDLTSSLWNTCQQNSVLLRNQSCQQSFWWEFSSLFPRMMCWIPVQYILCYGKMYPFFQKERE